MRTAIGALALVLALAFPASADEVEEEHVTRHAQEALEAITGGGDATGQLDELHATSQDTSVSAACRLYADRALALLLMVGQHVRYESPELFAAINGLASDLHVYVGYCLLAPTPPPMPAPSPAA